ncbi:MAG: GNAT family N-acetyltransferase [Gemmatimonadales bacterium]
MTPGIVTVHRCALSSPAAESLIAALNAELSGLYPEPGATHFRLEPDEVTDGRGAFVVAWLDGIPIGCGAVRRLDQTSAELKRMYVAPAGRGRGIGGRLLSALEDEARQLGVRRLLLETGIRQHAALALYARAAFTPIPPFGEYADTPTSVCLGKSL